MDSSPTGRIPDDLCGNGSRPGELTRRGVPDRAGGRRSAHPAPECCSWLASHPSALIQWPCMLSIGVPRETTPGETRVALIPQSVAPLLKAGLSVQVESGAGVLAAATDDAYRSAGAQVVDGRTAFGSDVVLKVREPRWNEEA